ncbi:hypothetical protein A2V49_00495 [candidate division WWE3 bacterium RBG_19FT_COMBO_34_6]|uniref:Polysaccharide chain length determinant N-terminal domain-containing protein n=1 Tax=candidate division WWE3 bacterium RBG_19FT_COMBO_34_6 TaxID=1802612 RepID=A0A1F4UNI8_UNCKA|nr:MAG: hypothetical protein A2V49_00495 [candidate division WWE3 bacterium RBG_19FT_COMBO_34_6]
MELNSMILFLKKYRIKILLVGILSAIVGIALFFLLPVKYYSSGSIFVKREIYPYATDHFTYEGYYGQQAAMSYTNSVIGLIKSEDITARSLIQIGEVVNEKNLRKYMQKIKAVKTGPQVITIITKGNTLSDAQSLWGAVSTSIISTMQKINSQNDPYVGLIKVSDEPITKESFKNIYVSTTVGFLLGCLLAMVIFSIKNYLTSHKRK